MKFLWAVFLFHCARSQLSEEGDQEFGEESFLLSNEPPVEYDYSEDDAFSAGDEESFLDKVVHRPPKVALGTAGKVNGDNDKTAEAVRGWLEVGGRHIDTATMYYNLEGVRRGILASNVPREDIYITLKIHMEAMGYNETIGAMAKAMTELGVNYIDLAMIHWPGKIQANKKHDPPCAWQAGKSQHGIADWSKCRVGSWHALHVIKSKGVAREIGVSNFDVNHLQEIFALGLGRPLVNQIEFNPWWPQHKLVTFCQDHKIMIFGYNVLANREDLSKYVGLRDVGDPVIALQRWTFTQGIGVVLGASQRHSMITALQAAKAGALDSQMMTLISNVWQMSQRKVRKYLPDPIIFPSPYQKVGSEEGELSRQLEPLFGVEVSMFLGEKWRGPGKLNPNCWSAGFVQTDCCHASFPPGGSSACWGGPFNYDTCCVPVLSNNELLDFKTTAPNHEPIIEDEVYDYVVVGSGSTGSVVAARLAELGNSVVLLEMGQSVKEEVPRFEPQTYPERFTQMPLEWRTGMVSRQLKWLTGKGLGGTSAVNGRLFTFNPVRDLPTLDFELLTESTKAIFGEPLHRPYADPKASLARFDGPGKDVTRWLERLGAHYQPDVENITKIGSELGLYDLHRLPLHHAHSSAFDLVNDKVTVRSLSFANRILFEGGRMDEILADGVKATGVEVFDLHEGNSVGNDDAALLTSQVKSKRTIRARKEVILSAGALSTPMLLQRSGVGPGAHLKRMKVETLVDNGAVGSNLQEHLYLPLMIQINGTCDDRPEWIAFVNPDPNDKQPIFELLGQPDCTKAPGGEKTFTWRLSLILLRSRTAGRLVPMSGHPFQHPHIEFNPFYDIEKHSSDLHLFVAMVRRLWQNLLDVDHIFFDNPFGINPDPAEYNNNYAALTHLSKNLGVWQHPSGTCKMNRCTDNNFIVRGTRNVRVADASVLPDSSSGHPEALLRVLGRYVGDVAHRRGEEIDNKERHEEEINAFNIEL